MHITKWNPRFQVSIVDFCKHCANTLRTLSVVVLCCVVCLFFLYAVGTGFLLEKFSNLKIPTPFLMLNPSELSSRGINGKLKIPGTLACVLFLPARNKKKILPGWRETPITTCWFWPLHIIYLIIFPELRFIFASIDWKCRWFHTTWRCMGKTICAFILP